MLETLCFNDDDDVTDDIIIEKLRKEYDKRGVNFDDFDDGEYDIVKIKNVIIPLHKTRKRRTKVCGIKKTIQKILFIITVLVKQQEWKKLIDKVLENV